MLAVLRRRFRESAEIAERLVELGSTSVERALEPAEDILKLSESTRNFQ